MEWLVLFMRILIGFVLLILEFLVFPGVNVAGILGFACVGIAIYIAYSTMGMTVGKGEPRAGKRGIAPACAE